MPWLWSLAKSIMVLFIIVKYFCLPDKSASDIFSIEFNILSSTRWTSAWIPNRKSNTHGFFVTSLPSRPRLLQWESRKEQSWKKSKFKALNYICLPSYHLPLTKGHNRIHLGHFHGIFFQHIAHTFQSDILSDHWTVPGMMLSRSSFSATAECRFQL